MGCAAPNAPSSSNDLSAASLPDLANAKDAAPGVDLATRDAMGTCTLGDPDHCGTCSTVCPPGMDTAGTRRTCSLPTAFGACGFICLGNFYDLDGKADNGCEAEDSPRQDSTATAVMVTLPDGPLAPSPGPGLNPTNVLQQIYGDAAQHATDPFMRPNGLDDWYQLAVTGTGASDRGVGACLGITNFPADNTFEVCLSAKGATTFVPAGCMQVTGGASSVCVQQSNSTDGTGTYYVRVRRVSGATYTANQYALYLNH